MASKNIIAKGTTYNGVESVTFPTSPSGTATFFEVSDTTATASDVLNSKYFYTAAGVKTQGTGTAPSPTLITKNITQNGTYDAEDDDADGYSSVTVSVSGGGGDSWSWMGKNPTKVKTCLDETVYLEDTPYATWTPSTTAITLAAAGTLTTETIDVSNVDVVVVYRFYVDFTYGAGGTNSKKILRFCAASAHAATGIPSTNAAWSAGTLDNYTSTNNAARFAIKYLDNSGVESYNTNIYYGVYINTSPSPSYSISNSALTITPKTPVIYANCNGTYFSTTNAAVVDQSLSYYHQKIEIWTVDKGTSAIGAQSKAVRDMWSNGDII